MIDPSQCLRVEEVVARTGLNPRTLDRRIAAGEVRAVRDPIDRRRRLIPIEDIPRLTTPVRPEPDQPDTAA